MSNTDNNSNTSPVDPDPIRPAQVTLNVGPSVQSHTNTVQASTWQEHRFTLFGIGIGIVLLVAVIFVLPNKVAVEIENPEETVAAPPPVKAGPTESPWQEQQFGKERREAQEILAKLLDKQKQLEEIQVWVWAEEDYNLAKATAENADVLYRKQEFIQAQERYNDTLNQFNQLLDRSKAIYQQSLVEGEQAIKDGDDQLATQSFQLAAIIEPDSEAPSLGLQRAGVLGELIKKVNTGRDKQREGNLEEAKEDYLAALALDEKSLLAKARLDEINVAIRDKNFGQQMSIGYAAINAKRYANAIAAFEKASQIKPEASDAQSALTQARNEKTQDDIQNFMQAAQQYEKTEEWQQAFDSFNSALALDPNLVAARVGAIRTKARTDVDNKLSGILEAPERLTTQTVHAEFSQYLAKSKAIPNPGPRLQQQLHGLELALQKAVQPVSIKLQSDNLTDVTVYRVGELGLFSEKQLTLRPGTYTVVGKRNGYRDVRQEFTVSLDSNQSVVTIQCIEKISKG